MSGRSAVQAARDGGSKRMLTLDGDDDAAAAVAWQRNADDATASLEHGCLKLGNEDIGEYNNNVELQTRQRSQYVTRYCIDHVEQSSRLCSGVTAEECVPCCPCGGEDEGDEEEERPVAWIWYLMGSELVLFTLHVSAIIFGVVKEALDLRQHESTQALHVAHSVVETVATFLILVIQMLNTRMGYVKVRQAVERLEHFDDENDAHLRSIKTWLWSSVAVGFVLVGVCVGCFIAFYAFVHLGWTVLSNQLCIVISLVTFGLYAARVVTAVNKIALDQYKVVVHEAVMLLNDCCQDTGSRAAALRFIESIRNTKAFNRPKYIDVTAASQQHRY